MRGISIRRTRLLTGAGRGRPSWSALTVVALAAAGVVGVLWAQPAAADTGSPCGATVNPIVCENSQTSGVTAPSVWDIDGNGDDSIQGFSTDISVNAGGSIGFKISTPRDYRIDVYRLGYYGGNGARLWAGNVSHGAFGTQPACLTDTATLNYDCGNWSLSATWNVPSNAVSGVYIAKLTATNGDDSHITFVVRNDASHSDITFQTSDETWQAYNTYGGSDFYVGTTALSNSQARAFKISYNRPINTRGQTSGRDFLFSNEYPTLRYLEQNGYDVSYQSGIDTDRYGSLLTNHKVFMSVGHDEYWTQNQRLNVEKARDAGVNLMFLSGNEVYWHTRFEPSIDGTSTDYRTLVCYKETWDDADTDPKEATGTWRDPRFGTAPGGANPENSLTGTMFRANSDDLPLSVTSTEGKMRLWRGTGLSSMTGSSTTLSQHLIGYESDEDVDNGFRPAGLVDLSTSTGSSPQILTDFGSNTVPGSTTHHVTLYRAASGALVFGAGTIQWGWGLSAYHDGTQQPADVAVQQATANMLADMSALPSTLMSGLTMPTPSTDTQAPSVTITAPAAGSTIANGTKVTVTGTATDNGGGQVAGVEVSLDGGTTWHPAAGRASWSYTGVVSNTGSSSIRVRATDDSANTSTPTALAATTNCPCSVFGDTTPSSPDGGDSSAVELGMRFTADTDGYIAGARFYKAAANTGTHTATLWSSSGSALATATFTNETSSGWQTVQFSPAVAVTADTTYVISYFAPNGHYSADSNFFYYKNYAAPPLKALTTLPDKSQINGVYNLGRGFPSSTYKAANYYVDVQFSSSSAVAPTVTAQTPLPGATSVSTSVTPSATFSKAMNAATVNITLTDPAGNQVAGSTAYASASKTATFTPASALADGTLYTATVTGKDANGNDLTATSWNFRTAYTGQTGGGCPCTVFGDSWTPTVASVNDPNGVELGIKFTSDTDGVVTGVRFYKGAQNGGIHTGSLWGSDGTQLATATFGNESTTGWQTVTFASPVAVSAGKTYVASYHTNVGYYAATSGGLAAATDNFPLHVPAGGAVYAYSTGFPTSSSSANYGVDVVFTVPASVTPTVTSWSPGSGATDADPTSPISATFNTSLLGGTASLTLKAADGTVIAGSTAVSADRTTLTFTPAAALAAGTGYTATITGARTLSGTGQSGAITNTFTTFGGGTGTSGCPCTLFPAGSVPATVDAGDTSAVTLGMRFVPSASGKVTGVRFYKAAANTGTHVGTVWSSNGTALATATFTGESASGWQSVTFSQPVAVTAGTTYTVGYYAPNGHYSATSNYFANPVSNGPLSAASGANGVYAYGTGIKLPTGSYRSTNYWVDVVFTPTAAGDSDTTPPTVDSAAPLDGSTSVPTSVTPTATFSEDVKQASITMTLTPATGPAVTGAVSYDAASRTATLTPGAALVAGTTYTLAVSASDTAGNTMTSAYSATFTAAKARAAGCPCSVWDDGTQPATLTDSDKRSVELGMTFTSDTAGSVLGVRFYKGPDNTGVHTASLWSADGTRLATGTVTGESTTGWQTLLFASPVAVTANTSYVVSHLAPNGAFSVTANGLAAAIDTAPLHVPARAGRYVYGGGGTVPTSTSSANYWVDPVFAYDNAAPVITGTSATPAGTTATVKWTTDEASTSRVDYGTSPTALTSSATAAGMVTAHTVTLSGLANNQRYYYRVTSADAGGNSTTSPATGSAAATFAPTLAPAVDTSTADFNGGTSASTYVSGDTNDGQLALSPVNGSWEADGTTVPSNLTSTAIATGGKTTVANGTATLSGSQIVSTTQTTSPIGIDAQLTLGGTNEFFGWTTTANSSFRLYLTVDSSKRLLLYMNDGGTNNLSAIVMTGFTTTTAHRILLGWTATTVTVSVDGVSKYSHAFTTRYASTYRLFFQDSTTTDANLVVDSYRLAPYATTGTFSSRVFDAGAPVVWDALSWDATVPTGTTASFQVRTGSSASPDASWTDWTTVSTSGGAINATGQYLQYRVVLGTGSGSFLTPLVRSVTATRHV